MTGNPPRGRQGVATGDSRGHGGLSPTLLGWLAAEPRATGTVLDVGTGTGRLALALAPRARRVLGIDTDAGALVEARRQARRAGLGNVVFVVADAEQADYRALGRALGQALGPPDVVTAHLCLSDAIIARAAAGLRPGGVLAFAAFHVDQWRETGRVSRFACEEDRTRAVLEAAGLQVEAILVERAVTGFGSVEEARAFAERHRRKWEAAGRWEGWERFLRSGGLTLTESRLVARARRAAPG